MSIASEIARLQAAKVDIMSALVEKGVDVPSGTKIDGMASLISQIGGVEWLAESLDFKFDGCSIAPSGSPTTPSAWYYNNDEETYGIDGTRKCGLLYNYYAVDYLNKNKETLCPGWHVPTKDEWVNLCNAVGGESICGVFLKNENISWASSFGGLNDYEFSVNPNGYRGNGNFGNIGTNADFWTSTPTGSNIYSKGFSSSSNSYTNTSQKTFAFAVRLVKDA